MRILAIAGFSLAVLSTLAVASFGDEKKITPKNILDNALLIQNGGPLSDLITGALSSEALTNHPTIGEIIANDPGTQKFFEYMIQCALPATSTVSLSFAGETYDFPGSVGLAPEWLTGPCEQACQEWVSACLFARVNTFGVTVALYLDGDHPAFREEEEGGPTRIDSGYVVEEGAFYGNMFLDNPRQYSCRGEGNDPLYLSFRVCSLPGSLCGLNNVGPCGAIDGQTGEPSLRHACGERTPYGGYTACRNRVSSPGSNEFPDPSVEYRRVITTYLPKTSFSDGHRAGQCVVDKPDGGVIEDGGVEGPTSGTRCMTDDDCNSDVRTCDVSFPNFMCTSPCTNTANRQEEEDECGGPGTTCLSLGTASFCTRSCTPGQMQGQEGSCAPGSVCTGSWLSLNFPDRVGCARSCSRDSDCNNGANCEERTGACGVPDNSAGIEDGYPCDIFDPVSCRGFCIRLLDTSTVGACGSVINLAVDPECPDDPELIKPFGPAGDDAGLCIFRSCQTNADCVSPLRCLNGVNGPICTLD